VNEIERAAAEHRQQKARAHAARVAKGARESRENAKARPRIERNLLESALGEAKGGKWAMNVAIGVALFAPLGLCIAFLPRIWNSRVMPWVYPFVALGLAFLLPRIPERLLARKRLRQLRRIGRGFDAERYLDQLRKKRHRGRLVVTLKFQQRFDAATRNALPDAIANWWPKVGKATWDRNALVIESAELRGIEHLRGGDSGSSSVFDNSRFHTALMSVVERVLPNIASTYPIASVSAEIAGHTEAWDAEP
jgi:hypothetical protein